MTNKFKYYCSRCKEWHYATLEQLCITNLESSSFKSHHLHGHNSSGFKRFTERFDKNEKELYEGNIVKYHEIILSLNDKQKLLQDADVVQLDFVGKIIWDEEGCGFDIVNKEECRGIGARGKYTIEIIGTTFENPEMLGKVDGYGT